MYYLQIQVTAESASGLVENITNVLETVNEEDETSDNLNVVANILEDVVGLISNGTFAIDKSVRYLLLFLPVPLCWCFCHAVC